MIDDANQQGGNDTVQSALLLSVRPIGEISSVFNVNTCGHL